MADEKHVDDVTGVETTGHVWDDDLRELNKPLPKWWLWTMYVSIVWAIGYWIVYPAWPMVSDYTKGVIDYSQRAVVTEQVEQAKAAQSEFRDAIQKAELEEIPKDQDLLNFALAGGRAAFANNCSQCHGRGAQGFVGYPNLNDDAWIWGGSLEAIHETIKYGIRNSDDNARLSEMPAFGNDELLEPQQINDVAEYVLSFQNRATDQEAAKRGEEIYVENCAACHMEDGAGMAELGAPKLSDAVWLYGGDKADIITSINTGRGGVMPPWYTRLDEVTIKQLAVYVHSLGGGQ